MVRLLFFLSSLIFIPAPPAIWINNLKEAKQLAKAGQKLILLNFSGSDWCIPCMRLRKEVFDADAFANYAAGHLILVNADFPRKKNHQLPKDQQLSNDELAEKYNPQGSFPLTVLLDSNGNKIKVWDGFYKNGAQAFVGEIKTVTGKE